MNRKEKSIKRLIERIKETAEKEKRADEIRERKHQREKLFLRKAKERRSKWLEKYETQAKEAARVIWKWYEQFIDSPMFWKIVKSSRKTHFSRINISRAIKSRAPSRWGGNYEKTQWFTLEIREKELFVHTAVKYGKSEMIGEMGDLLECVEIPILIAVAKTITDDTIWDIINIS